MNAKERERLERACAICRESGMEGEQLLLIRLEDVEEYLKLEATVKDIMKTIDTLEGMRKTLRAEVNRHEPDEDPGEARTDCEGG